MGILDLFKRLVQGKNAVDASLLQDIRRKDQADRARKRRKQETETILKLKKRQAALIRTLDGKTRLQPMKPRLTSLSIQGILGFEVKPHRRRRK